MSSIEASVIRAAADATSRIAQHIAKARQRMRARDNVRPVIGPAAAAKLIEPLGGEQIEQLVRYIDSPDFEQLAVQLAIAQLGSSSAWKDEAHSAVRHQLWHAVRRWMGLTEADQHDITDVLYNALIVGCHEACLDIDGTGGADPVTLAAAGNFAAMAARNGTLLQQAGTLSAYHRQAELMRSQVAALHETMRMPHTGTSRSVPWARLYVPPSLRVRSDTAWNVTVDALMHPGSRTVILGDPGAGKSTFATHLAFTIAEDDACQIVPFLVTLRDQSYPLRVGGRRLNEYLVESSADPYNVEISAEAVEYLLLNGRAIVILDGLDELTDVSLRRRAVELVDAFVAMYPLAPVVVTSRRVGYSKAPLNQLLFRVCEIQPFSSGQVTTYASNWFALEDSASPGERDQLCRSFLRESKSIEDLRSNPLLLALLCATHARERHLPRNRAEVYERCALTVFERWDRMRGIETPMEFRGRVRGAVQHLAWSMFVDHASGLLPRGKVLRLLNEYLLNKGFEEDVAAVMAEEFMDFCAGRAWVLTEVGTTESEPIYGFAHRTFLEYFAAEHLVRRYRSSHEVWDALSDKVGQPRWEVVSLLALQLLDRNADDGADSFLSALLDPGAHDGAAPTCDQISFAARSALDVGYSPGPLVRLIKVALDTVLSVDSDLRLRYWLDDSTALRVNSVDDAMLTLMYDIPESAASTLRRVLSEELEQRIRAGDDNALYLLSSLIPEYRSRSRNRPEWHEMARDIFDRNEDLVLAWHSRQPWGLINGYPHDSHSITEIFRRFGVAPFYRSQLILGTWKPPLAIGILASSQPILSGPGGVGDVLCGALLRTRTPWIPRFPWYSQLGLAAGNGASPTYEGLVQMAWPASGAALATAVVLSLPYLESLPEEESLTCGVAVSLLRSARARPDLENISRLKEYLPRFDIPVVVERFLLGWAEREVSVID